jgi:hypothetical protein
MLIIRKEQMDTLGDYMNRRFEDDMYQYLRSRFKRRAGAMEEKELRDLIHQGVKRAKLYGIEKKKDVRRYLECMIELKRDFDANEKTIWAANILRDFSLSGSEKMDRIDNYQTFVLRE